MHKLTYFEIHKVHKFHFEKKPLMFFENVKMPMNMIAKCTVVDFPNHFKLCFQCSNSF